MARPGPVPDALVNTALTRPQILGIGVSGGQLRSSAYRSPHRGIHVAAALPRTPRQRVLEASLLLPVGGAVGRWAAAHLHGAASRARTGADLARLHPQPHERVVALDALWAEGVATPAQVCAHLDTRPRLRGAREVREAASRARPGVRSRQETRLRWLWVEEAGLPDPLVDERVVDLDGHHLGTPDLLDGEAAVVAEFDGRDHLEQETTTVDNVRQEGLERHRLTVCRFTGLDLRPRFVRRTVFRLQQARTRGLEDRHLPRTWRVER
ncbi:hypothetical protein [Kineococcus sp. SYSU DK003]|uniref:hypothetical protein n=1 Tax=Kineococcus sp. SYSU DK003 TaxID=3383124 RepID=UPI003D7E4BA6